MTHMQQKRTSLSSTSRLTVLMLHLLNLSTLLRYHRHRCCSAFQQEHRVGTPIRKSSVTNIRFEQDSPFRHQQQMFLSSRLSMVAPKLSESDKERLLLGEAGSTAFIVAEMEHFVNQTMHEYDTKQRYLGHKWVMPDHEKIQEELMMIEEDSGNKIIVSAEYLEAVERFQVQGNNNGTMDGGTQAVELICNTTVLAFQDGFRQQGLLSALGSAIIYFRSFYRTPTLIAACERVGLSDYAVAHHITDMYHHRSFRGAYTKTLQPSGKGEIAARIAVGIEEEPAPVQNKPNSDSENKREDGTIDPHEDDECLLWSPITLGLCLHWKSDDEAWRTKRFERIQMEGTRDPRRGGSGTTR